MFGVGIEPNQNLNSFLPTTLGRRYRTWS